MKPSGIGGQAVIEGIMMRNNDKYSIAVRKPDGEIELTVKKYNNLSEKYKILGLPIIRGIFNFIDSLVVGMSTLSYSASFYEDPQEQAPTAVDKVAKKIFKDKLDSIIMAGTIILAIIISIGLFMMTPYFVSRFFTKYIVSETVLNIIESCIRLIIFIIYVVLISLMQDIKRVYMYHGAEHKCINCIENGMELNVKNVRASSRIHKRCGTSFMFLVMFVSIVFFLFLKFDSKLMQIVVRILLVPVIAGVSYEILKLAGRKDNLFIRIISAPGMLMQRITTKEPDDDMIEVAITAVEAVFDWRKFREEYDDKDAFDFVMEDSEEIPEFIQSRSKRVTEKKMKGLMEDGKKKSGASKSAVNVSEFKKSETDKSSGTQNTSENRKRAEAKKSVPKKSVEDMAYVDDVVTTDYKEDESVVVLEDTMQEATDVVKREEAATIEEADFQTGNKKQSADKMKSGNKQQPVSKKQSGNKQKSENTQQVENNQQSVNKQQADNKQSSTEAANQSKNKKKSKNKRKSKK